MQITPWIIFLRNQIMTKIRANPEIWWSHQSFRSGSSFENEELNHVRGNLKIEQNTRDIAMQLSNRTGYIRHHNPGWWSRQLDGPSIAGDDSHVLSDSFKELTRCLDWKLKILPRGRFQQCKRTFLKGPYQPAKCQSVLGARFPFWRYFRLVLRKPPKHWSSAVEGERKQKVRETVNVRSRENVNGSFPDKSGRRPMHNNHWKAWSDFSEIQVATTERMCRPAKDQSMMKSMKISTKKFSLEGGN